MTPLDFLFPPREDELVLRDVPTDEFVALLAPRLIETMRPAAASLLPFSDPRVRSALHEAKYRGSEDAFRLLSAALAEYLRGSEEPGRLILVPVPLGEKRRKERGFNQVEEVGRRAVRGSRVTMEHDLLARVRETRSQVSLPRALRAQNMRGAFSATRRAHPERVYLLLDDVTTTGATLEAAAEALLDAGATTVIPLALAH